MMAQSTQHEQTMGYAFINGAGLGSWIWQDVALHLTVPFITIDFPESRKNLSLDDYVGHALRQLEEWNVQKVVIVGHSLGGVVALKVADILGDRLAGFVAIGAAIPKNGGSFLSCLPFPKNILLGAIMRVVGTRPPESAIRKGLCSDLSEEQTQEVVRRFVPESVSVYSTKVGVGMPDGPKLYVKFTKDQEFGSALQDTMATNLGAQQVVELDTGHLPMLSKPQELARILNDFATKV